MNCAGLWLQSLLLTAFIDDGKDLPRVSQVATDIFVSYWLLLWKIFMCFPQEILVLCSVLCIWHLVFLCQMAFQFAFDFIGILVLHGEYFFLCNCAKTKFVLPKQLNKVPPLISEEISTAEVMDIVLLYSPKKTIMTSLIRMGDLSSPHFHLHKWTVTDRDKGKSLRIRHIFGPASIYSLRIHKVGILVKSNILKCLIILHVFFFF